MIEVSRALHQLNTGDRRRACYEQAVQSPPAPPELPGFASPGALRERLSGLVLAGAKTATFDLDETARLEPDTYPTAGSIWTMHDSQGRPLAVLRTTSARQVTVAEVTKEMSDAEGESFASVTAWRDGHVGYWSAGIERTRSQLQDPAWNLTNDTLLVFEQFTLIERLAAADEGRYPVVELVVPTDGAELAAADLYDLDTIGIEEIATPDDPRGTYVRLRAGFASDEAAVEAERVLWREHGEWHPRFEVIVGDDWLDAWREHFVPLSVGRVQVIPDWEGAETTSERGTRSDLIALRLDPKRAWGTGAHSSTQLVLAALQSAEVSLHGTTVLDVGCGSGILALAALLLGANTAHGIDVERSAISVTLENAARNGLTDRITAAWEPLQYHMYTYDFVLANILAPVLIDLADELQRVTRPGGTLVLAGLVHDQLERVCIAFDRSVVVATTADGPWRCVVLRRPVASGP